MSVPYSWPTNLPEWTTGDFDPIQGDLYTHLNPNPTADGNLEQITTAARNTSGPSARGQRHWRGDGGDNNNSGGTSLHNLSGTELWWRIYIRHESGMSFAQGPDPTYIKELYFYTLGGGLHIYGKQGGGWGWNYNGATNYGGSIGWSTLYPGGVADGTWHCHEGHVRIHSSTGLYEAWLDNIKILDTGNINTGGGTFDRVTIGSNQSNLSTGPDKATDYDNLEVSAVGRIGPLNIDSVTPGAGSVLITGFAPTPTVVYDQLSQAVFRWRADDGTEIGANWLALENERTAFPLDTPIRLRVAIARTGGATNYQYRLEYKKSTDSIYQPVTVGSGAVRMSLSANVAPGGEPTTQQFLAPGGRAFSPGVLRDDANGLDSITIEAGRYTELEWCIVVTSPAQQNDRYQFRVTVSKGVQPPQILFLEEFEAIIAAPWYDNVAVTLTTAEKYAGAQSLEYHWNISGTQPTSGGATRRLFTETDSLYVSYWIKYSAAYVGSGVPYHPHIVYLISTLDAPYSGPAFAYLNFFVEQGVGTDGKPTPKLAIQDSQMVDTANIGVDLTGVTENRSVTAANGVRNTGGATYNGVFGGPDYYSIGGGNYYSAYIWVAPTVRMNLDQWQHVEAYAQLNSIVGGIGQLDGKIRCWIDGVLAISNDAVIFRTGANSPDPLFNQLCLAPYISVGSPAANYFWMDDVKVGVGSPYAI